MRPVKRALIIFTAYLGLSILFTWPLARQLTTHGFGHDEDAPYHIWHNWWLKYSLFDLKQNPLRTDFIFHPQKINLIYDANAFVFSALTLPFQFLTKNVVLSSNIVFLFSFALSGLLAFLITHYLISNYPASFIAGSIFAFNPYTLAQAVDGHTNLTTTWMIPLYTLLLLKSLSASPRTKIFSMAAGLVAALQLYNDFTYTSFLIIETGLILAFLLVLQLRHRDLKTILAYFKTLSLTGLTTAFLGLPILWEVFKAARAGFRAGSPLWVQNVWSADFLTLIRPNDQTTFLPNPWTPNIGTVEGTAFLGYSVIVLLIAYGLWQIVKKIGNRPNINPLDSSTSSDLANLSRESWNRKLMIFLTLSFFLLLLGPSFHFANNFQFPVLSRSKDQLIFPLPYLLLHKIPFVGETQEPGRMFPFFILPLSVLVATILKKLTETLSHRLSLLLLTSYFLLLIFEYLPIPFPTTNLQPVPLFDQIRRDEEKKAVLTLPLGFNSGNYVLGQSPLGSLQFYQAYFQKPSFRATVARLPYANFEYYQKLPLLPYLIDPESPINLDGEIKNKELAKRVFKDQLHIKYVIVFKNKYRKPMGETLKVIKQVLDAKTIYSDTSVEAYVI